MSLYDEHAPKQKQQRQKQQQRQAPGQEHSGREWQQEPGRQPEHYEL